MFGVQYLLMKVDSYQKLTIPMPKMPDLNIHSVYNMVNDNYKPHYRNSASQYTTVDVRKLPTLSMDSYFQTLKVFELIIKYIKRSIHL